jgi:hypothetical protein
MEETWLTRAVDFWNEWAIRIAASVSLAALVLLMLLAETRRRSVRPGLTFSLWLVYQILHFAGSYALGHLSLDATGETEAANHEQVLIAFWAPFLLLHLGGPDNVGAYSLDDDKLSWRNFVGAVTKALGAVYIVYTKIFLADSSGLLSLASIIMIIIGLFRFIEMAIALLRSLSKKAWDSSNKKQAPSTVDLPCRGNEDARKIAQGQWQYCGCRALFDSSVEMNSTDLETSKKIFNLAWKEMCKVVEVEASLMYDMLYTKASVVYTTGGYILRLIAPLATSTAIVLFCLYPKDTVELPDLVVTYIVLGASLVLDVVWLVMALSSTWTYVFLAARSGTWLHHKVLCGGWWCGFRRFAMCLHPCRLLGEDPTRYKMWSDTIGRFNMLQECTRTPGLTERLCRWLATNLGLEDASNEYRIWKCLSQLPQDVKGLVFERIKERLSGSKTYFMKDIRAFWGQEAVKRRNNIFDGLMLPYFGHEFQEDILLWHIATTIYLCSGNQPQLISGANAAETQRNHVKAIEMLSEYLMFLVMLRPHMVPDPSLRRLCDVTIQALKEEYVKKDKENNPCCAARKQKLAEILHSREKSKSLMNSDANRRLVSDAARLAIALQEVKAKKVKDVVELIFDVWVDKLLYASVRCTRESHARQLGRGGELITIVWIVAEHAGLFPIGREIYDKQIKTPDKDPDPENTCCPKNLEGPVCPHFCCEKDHYC